MITLVGSVSRLNLQPAGLNGWCEEEPEMIIWDMGVLTKSLANNAVS